MSLFSAPFLDAPFNMTTGARAGAAPAVAPEKFWGEAILGASTIIGGLINSRGARRANRMTQQSDRENIQANWQQNREQLRAQMQMRQDDYQREVTRNRRAISPYRQMYSGPSFQFAEGQGPDAPIYNPLMEEGSMFNQLGQAPTMPWAQQPAATPPRGR